MHLKAHVEEYTNDIKNNEIFEKMNSCEQFKHVKMVL